MPKSSIHVEIYNYIAFIKACAKLRDVEKGQKIHEEVCEKGFERNLLVASTLISMYANCGLLRNAQILFDKLLVQDSVLWNTLISGYVQHGQDEEALRYVHQMLLQGFCFDNVTYLLSLKACGSIRAIQRGQELHCRIAIQNHLERDLKVGNALIDMYMKCGSFSEAKNVFDVIPVHDAVSWNAQISAYAKQGLSEDALHCYEQMHVEGVFPDAVTMACSLKACGSIIAIPTGRRIHAEICWKGILEKDTVSGNALIDMYIKCGMLQKAKAVFNQLPCKDAVSWTILIEGYARIGHGEEALNCFEQMQREGISPDPVTLLCILKACSVAGAVDIGLDIHAEIARRGLMDRDLIGNALIDMYAKCNLLMNAKEVFYMSSMRDVVSWNALLGGYTQHGYGEEALDSFRKMQIENVPLDAITYVFVLNACGIERAFCLGCEIHGEIVRRGLLSDSVFLCNALVDMYAKCGAFFEAWEVLDTFSLLDASGWNALIAGYVEHRLFEEAIECFYLMQHEGAVFPDAASYVLALRACSMLRDTLMGVECHAEIYRRGFQEGDLVIGNVLVDTYCNCGRTDMAQEMFDNLPSMDVVTWTVLVAGYARQGLNEEALRVFEEMQQQGYVPGVITYVCALPACGSLGALGFGLRIHTELARKGLLEQDITASNALLDMYASCGLLASAQETFDSLSIRNVISWSSLIAGYAQVGATAQVFHVLQEMEHEGQSPNSVTFVSILNACSHAGQVDEGHFYFKAISDCYDFIPSVEHYNCLIDLSGRVGQLNKASWVLKAMPLTPNAVIWHTLLGACKKWHDQELGREAFNHAMGLDIRDGAVLVCVWNIFADVGILRKAG